MGGKEEVAPLAAVRPISEERHLSTPFMILSVSVTDRRNGLDNGHNVADFDSSVGRASPRCARNDPASAFFMARRTPQ